MCRETADNADRVAKDVVPLKLQRAIGKNIRFLYSAIWWWVNLPQKESIEVVVKAYKDWLKKPKKHVGKR